jgi:hypothetical protein
MTSTIITASIAALLFAAPGVSTKAPLPTGTTAIKPTVKITPKAKKQLTASAKFQPKFVPLLSKAKLLEGAKAKKIVPTDGDLPLTEIATVSAGKSREGGVAVDFLCANVYTSWWEEGFAAWPHRMIEMCRSQGFVPGLEVVFEAQAGTAYAVECNSEASPRWRIKHKVGEGGWSPTITVDTWNPVEYVLARTSGRTRVQFKLDPVDNHILQQGVRYCRVSRIG